MSKHTPGPWHIDWHQRYGINVPHKHIAMVSCFQSKEGDWEENEANAHLIAAAPELLEALRMWMEIHDKPAGFIGKFGKSLDAAIEAQQLKVDAAADAARAAIAKATGENT